jgi:hypothetical protein
LIEQHGQPAQLIFVWFSNNSPLAVVILLGIVFFIILVIVGVRCGTAAPARFRPEKMLSDEPLLFYLRVSRIKLPTRADEARQPGALPQCSRLRTGSKGSDSDNTRSVSPRMTSAMPSCPI